MPTPPRQRHERRSLSTVSAPGRIGFDGDRGLGQALADALGDARDREVAESLTHPVHTYPARMHPATSRRLIALVMDGAKPGSLLVDPFCGSGTTLVEARYANIKAIGTDLSPLAAMIARAKTWTVAPSRRRVLKDLAHRISGEVLAAGKAARRASHDPAKLRKVAGFDPNARDRRVAPWFYPHVRRELEDIASRIDAIRRNDAELGEVLTVLLSSILYKVSRRSSDTDPTKVDRAVGRGFPARLFAQRAELLCAGLDDLSQNRMAPPEVREHDARALGEIVKDDSVTGIVTSPPYPGTYDYAETQRLRFDFLGLRHRAYDEGEIGARRWFATGSAEAANKWREDLAAILDAMANALRRGGRAAIVTGDSLTTGGRARLADEDVRAMLDDRLALVAWAWQERPALGAAERTAFAARGKREHLLLLERR